MIVQAAARPTSNDMHSLDAAVPLSTAISYTHISRAVTFNLVPRAVERMKRCTRARTHSHIDEGRVLLKGPERFRFCFADARKERISTDVAAT